VTASSNVYRPVAAQRAFQVLEHLARHGASSLQSIAQQMDLPRSSLLGLLQVLESMGYIRRPDEGRYALGYQLLTLSQALLEELDLPTEALPGMGRLTEQTQETTHLGLLDGSEVVYIQKVESPRSIKLASKIGSRASCHSTSLGKILLAWLPEAKLSQILPQLNFVPRMPNTLLTLDAYRAELEQVRRQGYAVDNEENELGVRCVAAPIRDHRGEIVAALSVSGLTSRLSEDQVPDVARLVCATCLEISGRLGFSLSMGVMP
jgi:DNA-binding IclR family transcriptional regulator